MVNNILRADVGVVFSRNAFQSPDNAGLVPHFGGRPGVNPLNNDRVVSWLTDSGPTVRLNTVEEDGEKSEPWDEDVVETTGVAYSPDKSIVPITTPPPNVQESDQAMSSTHSGPDRRRQSVRFLQRRRQTDVLLQREPPSRSSDTTMFGNDNDPDALCWLSQVDMEMDANAEMVDQLGKLKAWWILEYLPLWQHYQDREGDWHKGFYFNRGKPRRILEPNPQFHITAKLRTRDQYVAGARVKGGVVRHVDF